MPLADRDIFNAICARFTDQPIEFIMEQYEKAKKMNFEIEKRLGTEPAMDVVITPVETIDITEVTAEGEMPRKKRVTRRSLVRDPATAITDDAIYCCLCGEKRQSLTAKHLARHGVSVEEYKKLCNYPANQALMSHQRLAKSHEIIGRAQKARLKNKAASE